MKKILFVFIFHKYLIILGQCIIVEWNKRDNPPIDRVPTGLGVWKTEPENTYLSTEDFHQLLIQPHYFPFDEFPKELYNDNNYDDIVKVVYKPSSYKWKENIRNSPDFPDTTHIFVQPISTIGQINPLKKDYQFIQAEHTENKHLENNEETDVPYLIKLPIHFETPAKTVNLTENPIVVPDVPDSRNKFLIDGKKRIKFPIIEVPKVKRPIRNRKFKSVLNDQAIDKRIIKNIEPR